MGSTTHSRSRFGTALGAALAGAAAGFLAGLGLAWVNARGLAEAPEEDTDPQALADAVRDRLTHDETLGVRRLQVDALAPGIVELAGSVGSRAEALRAARLARRVAGVRTVLNRLVAPEELVATNDLEERTARRRATRRQAPAEEGP
jgi:hypothetical protein